MFSRIIVQIASLLAPASQRERWREEWLAELAVPARVFDKRALGAFADAWMLRRTLPDTFDRGAFRLDNLLVDLRFSARMIRRHPGHSVLTVVVIAASVGLSTAVVTLAHAMFLKPWPITEPDRVAFVFRNMGTALGAARLDEHTPGFDVVAQNDAIQGVAGFQQFFPEMTVGGTTVRRGGELVTAAYFDVIGVRPLLGRTFDPGEDVRDNTELSIVISYRLWQRTFDRRRDIIGQRLEIHGKVATIIGVLGPEFHGLSLALERRDWWMLARPFGLGVRPNGGTIIRLKAGASAEQAAAGLAGYGRYVNDQASSLPFETHLPDGVPVFVVVPANRVRTPMSPVAAVSTVRLFGALLAVVVMVLLIAMTSITGLGVARGIHRAGEVAMRRMLGMSTLRLGRQLLTEQVLLATVGSVLAGGVAWNLILLTNWIVPERELITAQLDWRLFAVACGTGVVTALVVSLAPLRQALHTNALQVLSGGTATTSGPSSHNAFWILTPQVTVAVVLLITAGVHVRSLAALEETSLGYTVDGRFVLDVTSSGGLLTSTTPLKRDQREALVMQLGRLMDSWPGVTAGVTGALPILGQSGGRVVASSQSAVMADAPERLPIVRRFVSPHLLDALNIRLLAGRHFTIRDAEQQSPVAIVSEGVARRLWPGLNPIGQQFLHQNTGTNSGDLWFEVIGVAADTHALVATSHDAPAIYVARDPPGQLSLVVAGAPGPEVVTRIRDDVQSLHPTMRVTSMRTLQSHVDEWLRPRRTAATLLALSGTAGLLLACIGLYAHVNLSVAQRRRELGVRSALGANGSQLIFRVVQDQGRILALGLMLGVGGGVMALRLTTRLVRDVPPADLLVCVAVPAVILAVCLLACLVPARHAGRVDPVEALRG